MTGKPDVSSELSRDLSLFQVTMMGLGMMIGAGVFLATGRCMARVGPGGVLLTFGLNGLVAIFTAMSYAELSSAIPRAGGAYNFARIGFGRRTSFVAGWMEWFASSVAGALYAVCFAIHVRAFLVEAEWIPKEWGGEAMVKAIAIGIALLFIYVNYRGASETGKVGAIMTVLQMGSLLFVGCCGVSVVIRHPERLQNLSPFLNPDSGWPALFVTMGISAVAFEGYEVIAQAGDETIDPRRNIPKAMLYSVVIVTFTYVICAFAAVVAVSRDVSGELAAYQWIGQWGGEGFKNAVRLLLPRVGGILVVLTVIFASTSALNATIYSATRASYALGRDGLLPAFFARISEKRKTPWVALMLTGLIVMVVAGLLNVEKVTESASIMFLFLFILVNLCVIRIRYNMGDELEYGYVMPFFPVLPVVAILCQVVLAIALLKIGVLAWLIALFWIWVGLRIYDWYAKDRAPAQRDEVAVLEEAAAPVDEDAYRIMVAVANPDNALSLVRTTHTLCGATEAHVELLHMVPVPDQVALSDADAYMSEGKEAIGEVMLYLAPTFPLSTTFRYCRNVARGIVSAVRQKRTNLLILGWHGHRKSRRFTLGSTIDPIIERVPCNVAILKNCGDEKYKRILVPVAGGPNSAYALELAVLLAEKNGGEIVVFTVAREEGVAFDVDAFVLEHLPVTQLSRDHIRARRVAGRRPESAILKEAGQKEDPYDLVVMGCTRTPVMRQFLHESVPEKVARLCSKPMIVVKASTGIRSWLKRWL